MTCPDCKGAGGSKHLESYYRPGYYWVDRVWRPCPACQPPADVRAVQQWVDSQTINYKTVRERRSGWRDTPQYLAVCKALGINLPAARRAGWPL